MIERDTAYMDTNIVERRVGKPVDPEQIRGRGWVCFLCKGARAFPADTALSIAYCGACDGRGWVAA